MRFYGKLLLLLAIFAWASSTGMRDVASDVAYAVRVKFVLAFGSASDFDFLIDDTQQMLAVQSGSLDVYHAGKRYRELLAEGLADAARRNLTLSEEELSRLQAACAREAFHPALSARNARNGSRPPGRTGVELTVR